MSIKTMKFGLIAVVGILSACHSTEPTRSVEWFIEHPEELKDAITKMEEVVRLNNRDIGVGFQLSLMYYRDEGKDAAIALLESVVRLQPQYANARWYLAAMYEEKRAVSSRA